MKSNSSTRNITIAAVLVAMGILIPMIMPKIPVPPASYTLGSHVPIFLSMFFSPLLAGVVALGTAFGFFLSGMPFIISIRALSHVIFAVLGAVYLKKYPQTIFNYKLLTIFNCIIGLIHALCEVVVVTPFFISEGTSNSYFITVVLLVGLGGFIHSLIDFTLAYLIAFRLSKVFHFPVFNEATLQQQFLKDG